MWRAGVKSLQLGLCGTFKTHRQNFAISEYNETERSADCEGEAENHVVDVRHSSVGGARQLHQKVIFTVNFVDEGPAEAQSYSERQQKPYIQKRSCPNDKNDDLHFPYGQFGIVM